jgi:hypothetical protein
MIVSRAGSNELDPAFFETALPSVRGAHQGRASEKETAA